MNQGAILNQFYSKDLVDLLSKLIGKETGTIVMHSSLLGLGFPREGLDYFADYLINKLKLNYLCQPSLSITKIIFLNSLGHIKLAGFVLPINIAFVYLLFN